MLVYHYTDAEHIDAILRTQVLRPSPDFGTGPLAPYLLWASPETP